MLGMELDYRTQQLNTRQIGTPSGKALPPKPTSTNRQGKRSHRRQSREILYDSDTDADGEDCVLSPSKCFSPSKQKSTVGQRVHRTGSAVRAFGNKVRHMIDDRGTNEPPTIEADGSTAREGSHGQQRKFYSKGWTDPGAPAEQRSRPSNSPSIHSASPSDFRDSHSASSSNCTTASPPSFDPDSRHVTPIDTSAVRGQIKGQGGGPVLHLDPLTSDAMSRLHCGDCPAQTLMAPYVDKLPAPSVVRVILSAAANSMEIYCSIDVLKMKSGLFLRRLTGGCTATEDGDDGCRDGGHWGNRVGDSNDEVTPTIQPIYPDQDGECDRPRFPGEVAVMAVKLDEEFAFDAVAYLESLHDGRVLFKGEWNACWARLSVKWSVQGLVTEYASIIDSHVSKLLQTIRAHQWRLNPNALAGYKIAIFRKTSAVLPTVLLGTIMECSKESVPGASRVRVMFDDSTPQVQGGAAWSRPHSHRMVTDIPVTTTASLKGTAKSPTPHDLTPGPINNISPLAASVSTPKSPRQTPHVPLGNDTPSASRVKAPPIGHHKVSTGSVSTTWASTESANGSPQPRTADDLTDPQVAEGVVGEVMEPFWVRRDAPGAVLVPGDGFMSQHTGRDATGQVECWQEPDELFLHEVASKHISLADIQKFWEMLQSVIDMPVLGDCCHCPVLKTHSDIANLLKKPEYKVLWIRGTPDILPKGVVCDLVSDRCVVALTDIKM